MSFKERVFVACKKIPRGRVSTYAAIAKTIGSPKAHRAVGNALNKNRSSDVPCHRVICSDGRIGGFAHSARKKIKMLMAEGVKIVRGRIQQKALIFDLPAE